MEHRSFLRRLIVTSFVLIAIELGWFLRAARIFLWKSPDGQEKIYGVRALGRGILRRFSVPKSISNKCSIAWRCTLKVCSPPRYA